MSLQTPSSIGQQICNNSNNNRQIGNMRDGRSNLAIDEQISEDEARRRREQLNRRPSYRMILKDLETVSDKPCKKELDETVAEKRLCSEQTNNSSGINQIGNSPTGSPYSSSSLSNGSSGPSPSLLRNSVGNGNNVSLLLSNSPTGSNRLNMIPPPPPPLPQTSTQHLVGSRSIQHSRTSPTRNGEIPSQPQPQNLNNLNSPVIPSTAAASTLLLQNVELLNHHNNSNSSSIKMDGLSTSARISLGFSGQHDWQNNLLASYNNSNSHLGGIGPVALGSQGSASLTSLSDNDDGNRKRQVRLLKNRYK